MSTSNTTKLVADSAAAITTGFAVYKTINKLVNPKVKQATGSDVITQASRAVTDPINAQIKALAQSVNKILPSVASVKANMATVPNTNIPT